MSITLNVFTNLKSTRDTLLQLVRAVLWQHPLDWRRDIVASDEYVSLIRLAREQALVGIVAQGLVESGVRLERKDALDLAGHIAALEKRNTLLDIAVAKLSRTMQEQGIRIIVMKGQTLALLYPNPKSRSCGDIDFLCHPDDWDKAVRYFSDEWKVKLEDTHSSKHVEFVFQGVQYELHSKLTDFAYPGHQRYWDEQVMTEVWSSASTVSLQGVQIPVLPPTINALYVFVHIFYHLIIDGIGLRQFCDWALVMERHKNQIDADGLKSHLEGLGLMKAFTGLGVILTDDIGLQPSVFPYAITEKERERSRQLLQNILVKGNFGHNHQYSKPSGVVHGLEHLWEIFKQSYQFSHYAPKEAWWRIPYMFHWWSHKIGRHI